MKKRDEERGERQHLAEREREEREREERLNERREREGESRARQRMKERWAEDGER